MHYMIGHFVRQTVASAAQNLLIETIPVVLLEPFRKNPLSGAEGSWRVLTHPGQAREIEDLTFSPNLGIVLAPRLNSPIVTVDVDGDDVWATLRKLGISSDAPCWISKTGRPSGRGFHVFFYTHEAYPRVIRAGGLPVDLLADGYIVIPPSNTARAKGGGGPYSWLHGHSPTDIPVAELAEPPGGLREWWMAVARNPKAPDLRRPRSTPDFLRGPVPEGARNQTLTRIGGFLRRQGFRGTVIAAELATHNLRCHPPLPESEVQAIAESVSRYSHPGLPGHPKAVVPRFAKLSEVPHG